MKTSRYTEAQIIAILQQAEGGVPVSQLCREHGMMPLPGNGLPANHERGCIVLQMAGQVWRHGCVDGQPDEGDGMRRIRKRSGGLFSRRMKSGG
jgi:hypothetical protein